MLRTTRTLDVVDTSVRQRRASRLAPSRKRGSHSSYVHVKMNYDDYLEGEKPCPKCHSGVKVSKDGCSQTICYAKSKYHPVPGEWFTFCWHCKSNYRF